MFVWFLSDCLISRKKKKKKLSTFLGSVVAKESSVFLGEWRVVLQILLWLVLPM